MDTEKKITWLTPKSFLDGMIRAGILLALFLLCFQVFSPFLIIMVWGLVLAIMIYPLNQKIAKRLKVKQGIAATIIVLVTYTVIGIPLVMVADASVSELQEMRKAYQNNELKINPPDPGVKEWPVIGERLFEVWTKASEDLPTFMEEHAQQLTDLTVKIFDAAGSGVGQVFLVLGALAIAGIMMGFGEMGYKAMRRVFSRIAGDEDGPKHQDLVVATTRSVATGVLGVAFFQALLFGVCFVLAGVPAPGMLAIIVLFIGIIQLPAIIVALPAIIYVWVSGDGSAGANIFYTILFVIAGLSDNVLKPLLLGRGVDVPMPVILIGALGGMFTGGFLGLFLGAILLAVGYRIFMDWVDDPVKE